MSLSVIIPTLNAAGSLPGTLARLDGVDEVIVVDGGSADGTVELASRLGARAMAAPRGRGRQLMAGAEAALGDWLLLLHADTRLDPGWRAAVETFRVDPANRSKAAVFLFALDDPSTEARRLERLVAWRVRWMGLPYGDQGLLISRDFYRSLGGFRPLPLMEDVDLVRRIGRRRLVILPVAARTSAARWRRDGWIRRSLRNLVCLALYFLGAPPRLIQRLYG
ncbi:TIGR04283 family arsenosugar biosynthesis glycosyltransferase [Methylocapsa aurea]|uniref:TIGR04283 family arsenosugar biosynthesis glycosyltransferase n=1 Tax=Methylocapsa aurea TaxID=663610 RepID=UPI00056742B4|nr:TIGR04283 family arsenosugar biosynthesis glycosyltransferase [Methylocapsa aurea]